MGRRSGAARVIYLPRPQKADEPVCRGSFEEAAACVRNLNTFMERAGHPYFFASLSHDDPYRIGLFSRDKGEVPPAIVDFENYRPPAVIAQEQAEHLSGIFTRLSFARRDLALWEGISFENSAIVCEVVVVHEAGQNYSLYLHGVTPDFLKVHAPRIATGFMDMPRLAP